MGKGLRSTPQGERLAVLEQGYKTLGDDVKEIKADVKTLLAARNEDMGRSKVRHNFIMGGVGLIGSAIGIFADYLFGGHH